MNAVILSDALDTNGQNTRYAEASRRHGKSIKSMVIGNADPAGVVARFQEAADRINVGLTIRSAHRVAYEYMQFPADIVWNRQTERQVAQLVAQADVIHLNNSWRAADHFRSTVHRKPQLLHHHGSMFRRDPEKMLSLAKHRKMMQAVSTIDLQRPAPSVLPWLPTAYNVAELQAIAEKYARPKDGRVRIVHCPTGPITGTDKYKHTELFTVVVQELITEGVPIDLVIVRDATNAEVLVEKAKADIVYDQLTFGYGCNSVEAWGLGKPVIAGADEWTLNRMARIWPSVPFEEATTETLKDVIRRMVKSEAMREDAANRGMVHVLKYHDELPALERLAELYHDAIRIRTKPRIHGKGVTFHSATRRSMTVDGQVVQFNKGSAVVTDVAVVSQLREFATKRPHFGVEELG